MINNNNNNNNNNISYLNSQIKLDSNQINEDFLSKVKEQEEEEGETTMNASFCLNTFSLNNNQINQDQNGCTNTTLKSSHSDNWLLYDKRNESPPDQQPPSSNQLQQQQHLLLQTIKDNNSRKSSIKNKSSIILSEGMLNEYARQFSSSTYSSSLSIENLLQNHCINSNNSSEVSSNTRLNEMYFFNLDANQNNNNNDESFNYHRIPEKNFNFQPNFADLDYGNSNRANSVEATATVAAIGGAGGSVGPDSSSSFVGSFTASSCHSERSVAHLNCLVCFTCENNALNSNDPMDQLLSMRENSYIMLKEQHDELSLGLREIQQQKDSLSKSEPKGQEQIGSQDVDLINFNETLENIALSEQNIKIDTSEHQEEHNLLDLNVDNGAQSLLTSPLISTPKSKSNKSCLHFDELLLFENDASVAKCASIQNLISNLGVNDESFASDSLLTPKQNEKTAKKMEDEEDKISDLKTSNEIRTDNKNYDNIDSGYVNDYEDEINCILNEMITKIESINNDLPFAKDGVKDQYIHTSDLNQINFVENCLNDLESKINSEKREKDYEEMGEDKTMQIKRCLKSNSIISNIVTINKDGKEDFISSINDGNFKIISNL
jgi:hypothetical protein